MCHRRVRLLLLLTLMFCLNAVAFAENQFQCLINLTKAPNWNQENVVVNIVDFGTKKVIQTINLTAETKTSPSVNSVIEPFDCNSHPIILLQASYTPSIWSTDVGKVYNSKDAYDLTTQILTAEKKGIEKIEVTLNFPNDFQGVPSLVN